MKNIILITFILVSFISPYVAYSAFPMPAHKEQRKETFVQRQVQKLKFIAGPYGTRNEGNPFAVAALVCGISGLFVLGLVLGAAAIVCGIIGLSNGRAHQGMASWGLALGLLDFFLVLFFVVLKKH